MFIGLDFDNTIACYEGVFHRIAVEEALIPADTPTSKQAVRDYLRGIDREDDWTRLQGEVYGNRMDAVSAFPGVPEFFAACRVAGIALAIISHKTRHPFMGPTYDLHDSAWRWLRSQPWFDSVGMQDHVYFELTKDAKLARIGSLRVTHFVDDLPEFLSESGFPAGVEPILFDPDRTGAAWSGSMVTSWIDLRQRLIGKSD